MSSGRVGDETEGDAAPQAARDAVALMRAKAVIESAAKRRRKRLAEASRDRLSPLSETDIDDAQTVEVLRRFGLDPGDHVTELTHLLDELAAAKLAEAARQLPAPHMAKYGNRGLDHVAIAVQDVERSQRFYAEVLGFERAHEAWDVPVVMAANGTGVAIFDKDLHPGGGAGRPEVRILHIAFRVDREGFERARGELAAQGLEPRFSDHGIAHSIYFSDPDGHELELTTYET